jgi:hypothetical protein
VQCDLSETSGRQEIETFSTVKFLNDSNPGLGSVNVGGGRNTLVYLSCAGVLRCAVVMLCMALPQWGFAETLAEMLSAVRSTVVQPNEAALWAPSDAELAQAEKLFRRLLAGESGPKLRQQWASLGFELTGTRSESVPYLVLQESGEGPTQNDYVGKGFFVFAVGRNSRTVLQAPHSFHDAQTEAIALELIVKKNFRAAAWNTAPAKLPVHSTLPPDMQAKPVRDYMWAFTRALMTVEPNSRVVQLHSFEKKKMYTANGSHADIILSGYGGQANRAIGWLSRCLKKNDSFKVRTFPFEVQEMGAGKNLSGASDNVIGELMQKADSQGFVHLGMSGVYREELRSYPQVQEKLFACLSRE